MKDKKLLEGILLFPNSSYYKKFRPYLLKLLRLSRSERILRSPIHALAVQLALLDTLGKAEKTIREQLSQHKMEKNNINVIYNQRIRYILKDIADGIAWRVLNFNRPLLRILSQNRSPGHIKTDVSQETSITVNLIQKGKHILINDVTNFLRIGDFTLVDNNSRPTIIEAKKSGKKLLSANDYKQYLARGGNLTKQAKRILEVEQVLKDGVLVLGEDKAKILVINTTIDTYLPEVENIVHNSVLNGYCERFIEKFLFVRSYKLECIPNRLLPPFNSRNWVGFSNLETMSLEHGELFRNRIPYSCYPFCDTDVLSLISGEIILESFINLEYIKKYYRKHRWKVRNYNKAIIDSPNDCYEGNQLFNKNLDTTFFILSQDGFNINVPGELIDRIFMDFLKPNFIIETATTVKHSMQSTRPKDLYVGFSYPQERYIWK